MHQSCGLPSWFWIVYIFGSCFWLITTKDVNLKCGYKIVMRDSTTGFMDKLLPWTISGGLSWAHPYMGTKCWLETSVMQLLSQKTSFELSHHKLLTRNSLAAHNRKETRNLTAIVSKWEVLPINSAITCHMSQQWWFVFRVMHILCRRTCEKLLTWSVWRRATPLAAVMRRR